MNKNLRLNLPKKWLYRVIVFLFISACFYACQKQEHEPPEENPITTARAYFDRLQKSSTIKATGASFLADSLLESRRVDWPSAFSQQKGDTVTVFAPLRFPFAIRTETIDQEKIFLNDLMYLRVTHTGKGRYKAEMLTLIPSKAWLEGHSFEGHVVLEDWFAPLSSFFSTSPEKENKQQQLISGLAGYAASTASSGCIRYEVCAGEVITSLPPSHVEHLMSTGTPTSPEGLPSNTIQFDEVCHTDYYCPPGGGGGGGTGGGDPGDWPDLPPPGGGGGGPGGSLPGGPSDTHNPPSEAELSDMLENKPFALFGDVPCDIIRAWVATATFTVSQSTWDKLYAIDQAIKPGTQFHYTNIQNINSAYSTVVNMDYFPVTINELPFVNGQQLTAPQFLEYIRKNINAFVDTDYSEFYPFNYSGVDDTQLWNSNNPLNAVVSIDIRGPDNGSVIVSHHSASKWTFTTIHDPMYLSHPVSGNRDFGYIQNANGSYTFYTRGVDRLTDPFGHYFQAFTDFPFNQADALWTSFVNKIRLFVNQNGGSAAMAFVEIERPDWQKVKDVLDGKAPLSTLSKDCPD